MRCSRPESASSSASAPLDRRVGVAIIPRLPDRAASESPGTSTLERPSDAIGYDDFRASQGLWRESEAFLRRQAATVFENSTACVYVETSRPRFGEPWRTNPV